MAVTNSYCTYVKALEENDIHKIYHDTEYGFPMNSDNELFGQLILEINQAGLSWNTILNKRENFRNAYSNFDIQTIANYPIKERIRLLNDQGIIRNRLKIDAVIHNARAITKIQEEWGSFQKWLDHHSPREKKEWINLFKKTFTFTGEVITNEFLMATGYLFGAHDKTCPVYKKVLSKNPKWQIN